MHDFHEIHNANLVADMHRNPDKPYQLETDAQAGGSEHYVPRMSFKANLDLFKTLVKYVAANCFSEMDAQYFNAWQASRTESTTARIIDAKQPKTASCLSSSLASSTLPSPPLPPPPLHLSHCRSPPPAPSLHLLLHKCIGTPWQAPGRDIKQPRPSRWHLVLI